MFVAPDQYQFASAYIEKTFQYKTSKMNQMIVIAVLCLTSVMALPYELFEDGDGEEYAVIPLSRIRRQTSVDISKSGPGTRVTLGHSGTLLQNDRHRLDGSAFASKQFKPSGPLTTGGELGYTHIPSGSSLNVGAASTRGFGTDFNAQGRYNIINDKRNTLSATGEYSRHFGGPFGTGRPNYGVGLQYQHRF